MQSLRASVPGSHLLGNHRCSPSRCCHSAPVPMAPSPAAMAGGSSRAEGLTRGAPWAMPLGPRSSLLPPGKRAMRGWEQGVPGNMCIRYWPLSPETPGGGQGVCSGFRPTKPERQTDCGRLAPQREPGRRAAKRGEGCGPAFPRSWGLSDSSATPGGQYSAAPRSVPPLSESSPR